MSTLVSKIKDAFTIKELRKRVLYTIFFVVLYQLGTFIMLPWIDLKKFNFANPGRASLLDIIRGQGNLASIFALGISPYITASILVQLASFLFPYFQRLQQEGMAGRSKLNRISRQLTVALVIVKGLINLNHIKDYFVDTGPQGLYWLYGFCLLLMMASSMFCVWLADSISDKGLGNGTSVLIMVGLLNTLPDALIGEIQSKSMLFLLVEMLILLTIVILITAFMQGTRKIHLQYARHMLSAYSYQGSRQYLPVKLNATGVMPIVFSSVFLGVVQFCAEKISTNFNLSIAKNIQEILHNTSDWKFSLIQAFLIFVSTFMYAAVFINPLKIANELKQRNGFISTVKPGTPTAEYIDSIVSKILFLGAIFLALITLVPLFVRAESIGVSKKFSDFYGGTALLIIIGVILEMSQQIASHLNMLYYDKMMEKSANFAQL